LKAVRERFNDTEGAAADRTGRSQNRNALHGYTYVTRRATREGIGIIHASKFAGFAPWFVP
jgi:hypothetical protein